MKLIKIDSWIEVVFSFILIFLLIISMHFSMVIAGLTDRSKDLAQEIAFLNREIERNKEIRTQIHADT